MQSHKPSCGLCKSHNVDKYQYFTEKSFGGVAPRLYWRCHGCDLIFLDPSMRLSRVEEKSRYMEHENSVGDPRYVGFLKQLWAPMERYMEEFLEKGALGLDFGCGPGPALHQMARQAGYKMDLYDPYFYPFPLPQKATYDFITCTEVVEHLAKPQRGWNQLRGLLNAGGLLGVMTQLYDDVKDFKCWPYRRDDTHISFYSRKTFKYIAHRFGFQMLECQTRWQILAVF